MRKDPGRPSQLETLTLAITDMDCADCARTLEEGVGRLPGVARAAVALLVGTMAVDYDPAVVNREQIIGRIRELASLATWRDSWEFRGSATRLVAKIAFTM